MFKFHDDKANRLRVFALSKRLKKIKFKETIGKYVFYTVKPNLFEEVPSTQHS